MPYQNRVDPFGRLHAVEARGAWMGNRGILHNDRKEVVAPWRLKRWITCALSFKGWRREVFAPRRFSQLFFLDEATSFAAGHRPCAECRRDRFREFRSAWIAANASVGAHVGMRVEEIDTVLHSERALRGGGKRTYEAEPGTLPSGAFIELEGKPHLAWDGRLFPWSFDGYGEPAPMRETSRRVRVLTPASFVRLFQSGFRPQVHPSVGQGPPALRAAERGTLLS